MALWICTLHFGKWRIFSGSYRGSVIGGENRGAASALRAYLLTYIVREVSAKVRLEPEGSRGGTGAGLRGRCGVGRG